MSSLSSTLRQLWLFRSSLLLILTPLVLLPLPLVNRTSESSCAYCILIMAVYWITDCLPLAVTALLPLILFPLLGIMKASIVSVSYMSNTSWLALGSFIIAIAIEKTNLHKRISLKILFLLGTSVERIMMGFMVSSFLLAMFVSKTVTTAMMLPIVEAVLTEIKNTSEKINHREEEYDHKTENCKEITHDEEIKNENMNRDCVETENKKMLIDSTSFKRISQALTLCIPYSASIGGICTIPGSYPNVYFVGQYEILYPESNVELTYLSWMLYHLPISIIYAVIAYFWLLWLYLGFANFSVKCGKKKTKLEENIEALLQKEYRTLGPVNWAEGNVIVVFAITVLLWFFRDPGFIPGWAEAFKDGYTADATVAIFMAVVLFVLPSNMPKFRKGTPNPSILNWKDVTYKLPWGIILLLGGGFAMAKGATVSGLSAWFGNKLLFLSELPNWTVCLIITALISLITECTSNITIASLFIPVVANLAASLEIHPLYLLISLVTSTSLAFMLPVATPPNAIAFSYGRITVITMIKSGWLLNIIGVFLYNLFMNIWGITYFDAESFPDWGIPKNNTLT